MSATTVYSMQDDTVELVCHRHYGYTKGITEAVLDANPGLAAHGPTLPIGTAVQLPEAAAQPQQQTINLWN